MLRKRTLCYNHYCNHCSSRKAISITYSECVSIALGIQHAKRMCSVLLSSVASTAVPCLINGTIFETNLPNIRCVSKFCTTFSRKFSHSKNVMGCFLCCVFSVMYCNATLFYFVLLFFLCVIYSSLFFYCTVSACDVRAATLTEDFSCFFLSCKTNAKV
jgi:hypothetical protein